MTVVNEIEGGDEVDLAIARALGILSPNEEASPATGSGALTASSREFGETAALLALSTLEAEPPARLRTELLMRITSHEETGISDTEHVDVFASQGGWHKLLDGVHSKVLFIEPTNGYVTSLLRMDPGARLPNHLHKGNEQCLILSGEFRMYGKVYGAGDFTVALKGSIHRDVYTETGATVLLVSPPDYQHSIAPQ